MSNLPEMARRPDAYRTAAPRGHSWASAILLAGFLLGGLLVAAAGGWKAWRFSSDMASARQTTGIVVVRETVVKQTRKGEKVTVPIVELEILEGTRARRHLITPESGATRGLLMSLRLGDTVPCRVTADSHGVILDASAGWHAWGMIFLGLGTVFIMGLLLVTDLGLRRGKALAVRANLKFNARLGILAGIVCVSIAIYAVGEISEPAGYVVVALITSVGLFLIAACLWMGRRPDPLAEGPGAQVEQDPPPPARSSAV